MLLRLLIPLALVAVVLFAAATASSRRRVPNEGVLSACVHSDRQLALVACRR